MSRRLRHPLVAVAVTLAVTVPWIGTFVTYGGYGTVHPGENVTPLAAVLVSGLAIPGAAFLLAWAPETAEKDVPQAFAIAVLAVLAVALEYAVDALYAWQAGPGSAAAGNLADAVTLDRDLATEITFPLGATADAFFIALSAGIGPVDIVFLVGLFVRYISIIIRGDVEPPSAHVGGVGRLETPSAGTDL